jgi:anthranilate phosphoribosyltransferase
MKSIHTFTDVIKILARGKTSQRSLTYDEAYHAMSLILNNDVSPEQLGAFLMLLRVKEETPQELAGFVAAIREHMPAYSSGPSVTIDWPSYSGKRIQPPWYLLAVFALANSGTTVFMHGSMGHTPNRIYTAHVLNCLGFESARDFSDIPLLIKKQGLCYMSLEHIHPVLEKLINMKSILGLRSSVNTLVRLINPAYAEHSVSSVFHPAYSQLQLNTMIELETKSFTVFKGSDGEVEVRPEANLHCDRLIDGQQEISILRASQSKKNKHPLPLDYDYCCDVLVDVWKGRNNDAYVMDTIYKTIGVCIAMINPDLSEIQIQQRSEKIWNQRDMHFITR